ncbi:hypothetical protein J3R30DRAFT_132903 [Lentinula aciculospora]|uniref:Anti-proliferative protein domain-containing protein n=1 Tax=Lentinula aciculospora TaxID=153920 RepID=A0A9W9AUP2_9AGAR|nr:hypothetical protein J3R30DRAFT_132903 [Lentinula aciculospora]
MSVSTMNPALTTLYHLVAYLTRPLIELYPSQTVLQLQFFLHANLVSQFITPETSLLSPFTLILSPATLPPTSVYAACLQAGVTWPQWIRALGGKALYVCLMENSLKVRVGEVGDAVTIWSAERTEAPVASTLKTQTETSSDERESPMSLKLQAMLDSVRTRSSPAEKNQKPSLLRSTTDDANDSESESDTESTTSLFSETSSTESMSSVSSTTSSPVSKIPNLPVEKAAVYIPRHRRTIAPAIAQSTETTPFNQLLSRSQRRLARATVDKAKVDVCRYTYQGGQTLVMTGGVMLGGVKPATQATKSSRINAVHLPQANPTSTVTKPRAMKVSECSNNWRARV